MTHLGTLNERLQSKMEQDRKELERQTQYELETLSRNLQALSQNALLTIEHDIQQQSSQVTSKCGKILSEIERSLTLLRRTLVLAWIRNCVLGMGIIAGMALGTLGISSMLSTYLLHQQAQITALQKEKTDVEQSLMALNRKTWGISLMENKEGKFVVLGTSQTLSPGWKVNNRPAWKLE